MSTIKGINVVYWTLIIRYIRTKEIALCCISYWQCINQIIYKIKSVTFIDNVASDGTYDTYSGSNAVKTAVFVSLLKVRKLYYGVL